MPDFIDTLSASRDSRKESTARFPNSKSSTFVLGRRPALDGLRGAAILAVLLFHTCPPLLDGGYIGVEIFFVLSGFLITALLLQEHQRTAAISLRQFYLRRLLRLLPALLAALAAVWVGTLLFGSTTGVARLRTDSLTILLYVHNWRLAYVSWKHSTFQFGPTWSLAIEEQFYLVWPAVLALLLTLRGRRRWVAGFIVLAMLIPPLLRAVSWKGLESFQTLYFSTHTRADSLASGCMVALLASWRSPPDTRWGRLLLRLGAWLAVAVLLVHLVATRLVDAYMFHGGFELVNLSTAVLLVALLWSPPPLLAWILETRPLRWLGRISYGGYLWNHVVFCLVYYGTTASIPIPPFTVPSSKMPPWVQQLLVCAGSVACGALSHYAVERPFLLLKDRLKRPDQARIFFPPPSITDLNRLPERQSPAARPGPGCLGHS